MMIFVYVIISAIFSLILSLSVYRFAHARKLVDRPDENRKRHRAATPTMGGIAIYLAFWVTMGIFIYLEGVMGQYLKYLIGLFIASSILLVTGIVDDTRGLSPRAKIVLQILAGLTIIAAGVGIAQIQVPFLGLISLEQINVPVTTIGGTVYKITLIADLVALIWIVAVINVMNFLDGLDSLAAGVSSIAFLVIALLSLSPAVAQPLSAAIAAIALGATLGFMPFNLSPARMFMGDTGSLFLGLVLATLAIVAGGKLATALLVFGLPIIDTAWVIVARYRAGRPIWTADRTHLHHKLQDLGYTDRQIAACFLSVTAAFGLLSFVADTMGKALLLGIMVIGLTVALAAISRQVAKKV